MTNLTESKRLNDEELEAVAGGVTPPTIDPSALAGLMHSTVSAAISGGGAYAVDTHAGTGAGAASTTMSGSDLASIIETVKATAPTTTRTGTALTGS